jgi:predicted hydrocarbon binding protein
LDSTTRIGNIQELFDAQVNMMVSKRALPEVIAFLITHRGVEQAEEDLRDIARIITQRLLLVWVPKSMKPFKMFKEMMQLFFGNKKVKGKVLERDNKKPVKIAIRDYNCPICPDQKGEEVEVSGLHYCVAVSGTMNAIFDHMIENNLVPYSKADCRTVKSVGSGDEYCEHIITVEYKLRY